MHFLSRDPKVVAAGRTSHYVTHPAASLFSQHVLINVLSKEAL
jgi:hypothetical protein